MGCKAAEGDFVISEIANWAVLKSLPARKMTNMTNDSVIFVTQSFVRIYDTKPQFSTSSCCYIVYFNYIIYLYII